MSEPTTHVIVPPKDTNQGTPATKISASPLGSNQGTSVTKISASPLGSNQGGTPTKISVAYIRPNNPVVDWGRYYQDFTQGNDLEITIPAVKSYLKEIFEPLIEIRQISFSTTQEFAHQCATLMIDGNVVEPNTQVSISTDRSFSCSTGFVEMMYISKAKSINAIGGYLNMKNQLVSGNIILLFNQFSDDNYAPRLANMTLELVLKGLRRRYYHTAFFNDTKVYFRDLDELLGRKNKGVMNICTCEFYGYTLDIYYQDRLHLPEGYTVNNVATLLSGSVRIRGDVYIIHRISQGLIGNLSRSELDKLKLLSHTHHRKVNDSLDISKDISRYVTMQRAYRLAVAGTFCSSCRKNISNEEAICCSTCFAEQYCSATCLRANLDEHKSSCVSL